MKAFNYNDIARLYDALELDEELNQALIHGLDHIFKEHKVKSVWDASCGTGAQAIPLYKKGYKVIPTDLSEGMLNVAREKACDLDLSFSRADMRSFQPPKVDAVISLYNALAHLSREELKSFLLRLANELERGALLIGDFDNRKYLEKNESIIESYFLSGEGKVEGEEFKRLSRAKPKAEGLYTMEDRWYIEQSLVHEAIWDLQSWRVEEIKFLASECGFSFLGFYSRFMEESPQEFDAFLVVLQKA